MHALVVPLVDLAVKSLAIMALVTTIAALPRMSAARRHLAWCVGVVALLLLPVFSVLLPAWQVPWLPQWVALGPTDDSPLATVEVPTRPNLIEPLPSDEAAVAGARWHPRLDMPDAPPESGSPSLALLEWDDAPVDVAPLAEAASPVPWRSLLLPLWALGALVSLVPVTLGLAQLLRLRKKSSPVADAGWLALVDRLRGEMGVARAVALRQGAASSLPLTWGAWQPVLLIPAEADSWTHDRRRVVLMHELAHIRRWDWLTQLLARAAVALYWFNPLAWLAARRMSIERERACDDRVLACGSKPSDYAQVLLEMAAGWPLPAWASLATVSMARRTSLEVRLRAILDARLNRAALTARTVGLALVLAAAVVIPLAMLQAGSPNRETSVGVDEPEGQNLPSLDTADEQPRDELQAEPQPPVDTSTRIDGRVVDDETGEPLSAVVIQGGRFDPETPEKVTWGFTEQRSGAKDGRFSTTVNWPQGQTARVLVDGYDPHPLLIEAPLPGARTIVIRMKKGRIVQGQVLDHDGQPLVGVSIFAVGSRSKNLYAGSAWQSWGEPDASGLSVLSGNEGRFELPIGEAELLAASSPAFDAWPVAIPAEGPVEIKLPRPATIEVRYEIDGAAAECELFYQSIREPNSAFQKVEVARRQNITNGGKLIVDSLAPGLYQVSRNINVRIGNRGFGPMLDRQIIELAPGETKRIDLVRGKGARVKGKITWPTGSQWDGILVRVEGLENHKFPFGKSEWQVKYCEVAAGDDGTFLTERIPPGNYLLSIAGYAPENAETMRRTGLRGPTASLKIPIVVPESGELELPITVLGQPPQPDAPRPEAPQPDAPPPANKPDGKVGRLVGQLLWQGRPGASEFLELRSPQGKPIGFSEDLGSATTRTDADGRFTFKEVPAGRAVLVLSRPPKNKLPGANSGLVEGLHWVVEVGDGGITTVTVGGQGRKVIGRVEGFAECAGMYLRVEPKAPPASPASRAGDLSDAFEEFRAGSLGPLFFRDAVDVATDGSFEIDGLLPAEYSFSISLGEGCDVLGEGQFKIEQEKPNVRQKPLNVGMLPIRAIEAGSEPEPTDQTRVNTAGQPRVALQPSAPLHSNPMREFARDAWQTEMPLVARFAASMVLAVADAVPTPAEDPVKTINKISGRVVDAETGLPITHFALQRGRFDPMNPDEVIWNPFATESEERDGALRTQINWYNGALVRVVADGYIPQPVVSEAPLPGADFLNVNVRLKKGRIVRGQVLDHDGRPVGNAGVYAIGPVSRRVNRGNAWTSGGELDRGALPAWTDGEGRFELAVGEANILTVSSETIDAWSVILPAEGPVTILLPQPAMVEVAYDIPGAAAECELFYELLPPRDSPFHGKPAVQRRIRIANGQSLTLPMMPGHYQFTRNIELPCGELSFRRMLDRSMIDIDAGQSQKIDWTRPHGATARGTVTWSADSEWVEILLHVKGLEVKPFTPFEPAEYRVLYSATTVQPDGSFTTETLRPGRYELTIEGYTREPGQARRVTSVASAMLDVPNDGELVVPDLRLGEPAPQEKPQSSAQPIPVKRAREEIAAAAREQPPPALASIKVRGQVLDHGGKPVAGAGVFVLGDSTLQLRDGHAWRRVRSPAGEPSTEIDPTIVPVRTDAAGRFEVTVELGQRLAVSCKELACQFVDVPPSGDLTIRLTQAAALKVSYDLAGAPEHTKFRVEQVKSAGTAPLSYRHEYEIDAGVAVSVMAVPPGNYWVTRIIPLESSPISKQSKIMPVDYRFFQLQPGETQNVDWVAPRGARIKGTLTVPPGDVVGPRLVAIKSAQLERMAFLWQEFDNVMAMGEGDGEGRFITERVPAGRYRLVAEAFAPTSPTGSLNDKPTHAAETFIEVPESGELTIDVALAALRNAPMSRLWSGQDTGEPWPAPGALAPAPQPLRAQAAQTLPLPGEPLPKAQPGAREVNGQVFDHEGKPVAHASVFIVGQQVLFLRDGRAWRRGDDRSYPSEVDRSTPFKRTDSQGRFSVSVSPGQRLAVTTSLISGWEVDVPQAGDATICLPKPGTILVRYDIPGAKEKSSFTIAKFDHASRERKGVGYERVLDITNGSTSSITALAPGDYIVSRLPNSRPWNSNEPAHAIRASIDFRFVQLHAGETATVDWTRPPGAQVRGKLTWPKETTIVDAVVSIKSATPEKPPFYRTEWENVYALSTVEKDGQFVTERLKPGRYLLVAEAFEPLPNAAARGTGFGGVVNLGAEKLIDVPESGELTIDLTLDRNDPPTMPRSMPRAPRADPPRVQSPAPAGQARDPMVEDEEAIAKCIMALANASSQLREAAAAELRAIVARHPSGTSNIRDKDGGEAYWTEKVKQVTPGMTKEQVHKLLPPFSREPGISGHGSGQSHAEDYRLDENWTVSVQYQNPDKVLERPMVRQSAWLVRTGAPANFTGIWTTWFVNGQKGWEAEYEQGKYNGKLTAFHDNGAAAYEQHYTQHVAGGPTSGWDRQGKVMYRGQYLNGKQDGQWSHFYPSGQPSSETNFKDGKHDGPDRSWYENGRPQHLTTYRAGIKQGPEAAWTEQGGVKYQREIQDGHVVEK